MNAPISSLAPSAAPTVRAQSTAARIAVAEPRARLSLRARGDLALLNEALGVSLPERIGRRAGSDDLDALCLGPDEWMLHTTPARAEGIMAACGEVYPSHPHSLVDVSGREITFVIDGPRAAELLTLGCARDLDSIAAGDGRRTNFDGVTVVVWRDGVNLFRMDVWHSFAPHVLHLLETGCRELAAEAG